METSALKAGGNIYISKEHIDDKIAEVAKKYGEFLTALGYDWQNDPNMVKTPERVAKMYLKEITSGAYSLPPRLAVFPSSGYTGMVTQCNIEVKSLCSHHFLPFIGVCHIAYLPVTEGKVVGLSKLNRIVHWFAKRPQLQEQLTRQIHDYLCEVLGDTLGVIVYIEAKHMCVSMRGAEDDSTMITSFCSGNFLNNNLGSRDEFMRMISNLK